jgi:transcriptional regulator with XRE-family HTH domain
MALGTKVRQFRTERSMRAKELAEAAGVSPSLISQIENDVTTPSIDVLRRIAAALHVAVGDFFNAGGRSVPNNRVAVNHSPVVRANARKKLILPTSNWVYELLTPDLQGRLELLWLEIGPGSGQEEFSIHEGEEANVVIKGRVHIWVEDEEYVLEEGDAITFESSRPHRTVNLDSETAIVISAITPPSF